MDNSPCIHANCIAWLPAASKQFIGVIKTAIPLRKKYLSVFIRLNEGIKNSMSQVLKQQSMWIFHDKILTHLHTTSLVRTAPSLNLKVF